MKRSEMVKEIYEVLLRLENSSIYIHHAEAVLSQLEEYGVLPPEINNGIHHYDLEYVSYAHKWENE